MENLKSFYTQANGQRIIFGHEDKPKGGIALYLPGNGRVGVSSEVYTQDMFKHHPFMRYMFGTFGEPDIHLVNNQDLGRYKGAQVMATHFLPAAEKHAQGLGFPVQGMYDTLNNKRHFQEMVIDTLGTEYSTTPQMALAGTNIQTVKSTAEHILRNGTERVVVRIADNNVAHGGGTGVKFAKTATEATQFLQNYGDIVDEGCLNTDVLVEPYIPNIFSPSTTFFLLPNGIVPLTANSQILNDGHFIASSNVLPKELREHTDKLWKVGWPLAEKSHSLGARGFVGFDLLVTKDFDVKAVECNYRETGATIPEFTSQKAANFINPPGSSEWVFLLSIPYTPDQLPNFEAALEVLRKNKALLEKNSPLEGVQAVPLYGMQPDDFDIVFFWEKGKLPPEANFAKINSLLEKLGSNKRLQVPTIT